MDNSLALSPPAYHSHSVWCYKSSSIQESEVSDVGKHVYKGDHRNRYPNCTRKVPTQTKKEVYSRRCLILFLFTPDFNKYICNCPNAGRMTCTVLKGTLSIWACYICLKSNITSVICVFPHISCSSKVWIYKSHPGITLYSFAYWNCKSFTNSIDVYRNVLELSSI